MRRYILGILFGCTLMTTGCSITTPVGTAKVVFDKEETAAANTVKLGDKEFTISAGSAKDFTSQLLDSVTLPDGTDRGELKEFVYSNLEAFGINLDDVSFESDELTDAIESALKDAGVNIEEEE